MGYDIRNIAEMVMYGLLENDKVQETEIAEQVAGPDAPMVYIKTDTGQEFYVEIRAI